MPEVFNFSASVDIMAAADDREVPKLLYSRKDGAFALSISVRSLDYLIANKQLNTRKLGKKIMIPYGELSRFARADHTALTQHPNETAVHKNGGTPHRQ
jgi:hypothetical protein